MEQIQSPAIVHKASRFESDAGITQTAETRQSKTMALISAFEKKAQVSTAIASGNSLTISPKSQAWPGTSISPEPTSIITNAVKVKATNPSPPPPPPPPPPRKNAPPITVEIKAHVIPPPSPVKNETIAMELNPLPEVSDPLPTTPFPPSRLTPPPLPIRRKTEIKDIDIPKLTLKEQVDSSPRSLTSSPQLTPRERGNSSPLDPNQPMRILSKRPSHQKLKSNSITNLQSRDVSPKPQKINVYKTGLMYKTNRDGKEVQYYFTLDTEALSYVEPGVSLVVGSVINVEGRVIPLNSLVVRDLNDLEEVAAVASAQSSLAVEGFDAMKGFRLLSKQKSFYLRCESVDERNEWFRLIDHLACETQRKEIGRLLTEEEMALLKIAKTKVNDCQLCSVPFSYFARRHHCRNCGKCVCEACSREKVRIPRIDEKTLFKVCIDCAREIKNNRKYGVPLV